jgi:hypothetical protein
MGPRRSLLAFLLFALLFYVLPVHLLVRNNYPPLAITLQPLGLAGLPPMLHLEVSIHYVLVMILLYVLTFTLVALGLRLVQAYHWEGAARGLATITSIKDLQGLDRLLRLIAALAALAAVAAIPFWDSEPAAVLIGLAWFSLTANAASQPARLVPVARPMPPAPLVMPSALHGGVQRRYSWRFPESHPTEWQSLALALELPMSSGRYAEVRERPRQHAAGNWNTYVSASSPELDILAGKLLSLGRQRGYSSLEQVCNVLAFVQQCVRHDVDGSREPGERRGDRRYPIETLMEQVGNSGDQAILVATLLQRMGYNVALVLGPHHAAVGVAGAEALPGVYVQDPLTDAHYFYAGITATGWHIGELPEELRPALARGRLQIEPVSTRPV